MECPCSEILSFADRTTEDIFHGLDSRSARQIPQALWPIAVRKLDMLNAAHDLRDLKVPPANPLKALKGRRTGIYSIRVNDQYWILFEWGEGSATNVRVTDDH